MLLTWEQVGAASQPKPRGKDDLQGPLSSQQLVVPEPGTEPPAQSWGASETPASQGNHPGLTNNHLPSSPWLRARVPKFL